MAANTINPIIDINGTLLVRGGLFYKNSWHKIHKHLSRGFTGISVVPVKVPSVADTFIIPASAARIMARARPYRCMSSFDKMLVSSYFPP